MFLFFRSKFFRRQVTEIGETFLHYGSEARIKNVSFTVPQIAPRKIKRHKTLNFPDFGAEPQHIIPLFRNEEKLANKKQTCLPTITGLRHHLWWESDGKPARSISL